MNLIFLKGKIVSDVEFKFIINSKDVSIAIFDVELLNKSIVTVKAYNGQADYCYRKLNKNDIIFIEGYINTNIEVVVKMLFH